MVIFLSTILFDAYKFLAICPVLPTFKNPDLTSKNPVFMRVCGLSAHFPTFNTKLL
nr:MAG TPA: hypothetical protein [Caudoviricetes sp.]